MARTRDANPNSVTGSWRDWIFPGLKGFWGLAITCLTLWIAWEQLKTNARTIRPSLVVALAPVSQSVIQNHGELSHAFRLHNVGNLVARAVTLNIRTYQGGKTIHEDKEHNIGDLVIKEEAGYVVHVHEADRNAELIEEVRISYDSDGGSWFWCNPQYTYRATYRYNFSYGRWVPHPQLRAIETEGCR